MKLTHIFFTVVLIVFAAVSAAFAQVDEAQMLFTLNTTEPVSQIIWNDTGDVVTLVSKDRIDHVYVDDPARTDTDNLASKTWNVTTVSVTGLVAALSPDWNTIYLYDPTGSKELKSIDPGFPMLSVSVSKDGSKVLADSADQIRTVIFDVEDGSIIHDLRGFETAAPVYDSRLSPDGKNVLWHSRGTFALQRIEDGSFGKTISLWDFAASSALSPDSRVLAVGIINNDYENGAVIFFDAWNGNELGRTILGKTAPHDLSFNGDGTVLWAADYNTAYRIDAAAYEVKAEIAAADPENDTDRISRISSSPDVASAAVLKNNGELLIVK